jgi:hypothetical protein
LLLAGYYIVASLYIEHGLVGLQQYPYLGYV